MMPVHIRCCHLSPDAVVPPHLFFILSKGNNAGKPGVTPWANSFVVISSNQEMRDFYFWLTYGLFTAKAFRVIQRGTAIPFVNVGELRHVIANAAQVLYPKWQEFRIILQQLEKLEKQKNSLGQILKATATLQECLIRNYLQQQGIKT